MEKDIPTTLPIDTPATFGRTIETRIIINGLQELELQREAMVDDTLPRTRAERKASQEALKIYFEQKDRASLESESRPLTSGQRRLISKFVMKGSSGFGVIPSADARPITFEPRE